MKRQYCLGPQTYQAAWFHQLFIVRGMHQEPLIASNFAAGTPYGPKTGSDCFSSHLGRTSEVWRKWTDDMASVLNPVRFIMIGLSGWINHHQLLIIDYLREENRVLREQLGDRRPKFNDDQGLRFILHLLSTLHYN